MESWPNPLNTPKLWDPYALDFVVVFLFLAFLFVCLFLIPPLIIESN